MEEKTSPEIQEWVAESTEIVAEGADTEQQETPEAVSAPSEEQEPELSETPTSEVGDVTPRTYTQEEVSRIQSEEQRQVSEANQRAQQAERQASEANQRTQMAEISRQNEGEYQQVLLAVSQEEFKQVKAAEDVGIDPTLIRQTFARERQLIGAAKQQFDEQQRFQAAQRVQNVHQTASKYGLLETDLPTLSQAVDPEATAGRIKAERELEKYKTQTASVQRKEQEFTAPTGGTSGGTNIQQLLDKYNSGQPLNVAEQDRVDEYLC